MTPTLLTPNHLARFERFFKREGDGCWLWSGTRNNKGYGQFSFWDSASKRNIKVYAHRLSLALHTGTVGDVAMHACDVRPCVNPGHLRWGTAKDNTQDGIAKGRIVPFEDARRNPCIGERHGASKLTADDVVQIRLGLGSATKASLARQYGVCSRTILAIWERRTWRHIP